MVRICISIASMGLRDWVSEKARSPARCARRAASFNGAPRLGLGEGHSPTTSPQTRTPRFNGAPRLGLGEGRHQYEQRTATRQASMGLRDWVSEKGRPTQQGGGEHRSFNGAPRLGLGEGEYVTIETAWEV